MIIFIKKLYLYMYRKMHVKDIYQIVNNDISGNGVISNGVEETGRGI